MGSMPNGLIHLSRIHERLLLTAYIRLSGSDTTTQARQGQDMQAGEGHPVGLHAKQYARVTFIFVLAIFHY